MQLSQQWTEVGGRSAVLSGERFNVRVFPVSGGFNVILTVDNEPETSNHPGLRDAQEYAEQSLRAKLLIE